MNITATHHFAGQIDAGDRVLAHTVGAGLAVGLGVLLFGLGLAFLAFAITAVVTILRSRQLTGTGKVAWVVGVLAFPFLGSLAWFVIGRRGVPRLYRSQMV